MTKIDFKKAVAAPFKAAGFVAKGQSFFKDSAEIAIVINLQKSDFDEKYYVNLGVWLKGIAPAEFPSANKCHIQSRLTSIFPDQASAIDAACHLGASEHQVEELVSFLEMTVVPFCEDCLHIDGLNLLIAGGRFKRALVMQVARNFLASP